MAPPDGPTGSASYKAIKSFSIPKQAQLLLCRLTNLNATSTNLFSAYNYGLQPYELANGFPATEAKAVNDLLLAAPWKYLENSGLIRHIRDNFYCITEAGFEAAKHPGPAFANREIVSALPLLHPAFQDYVHYFHENRLKEAVTAALERYENRLNEVRQRRPSKGKALSMRFSGKGL